MKELTKKELKQKINSLESDLEDSNSTISDLEDDLAERNSGYPAWMEDMYSR